MDLSLVCLFKVCRIVNRVTANGLHLARGGFKALSCPPKSKLAMERKPCWQPFTRHKLYAVLCGPLSFLNVSNSFNLYSMFPLE